MLKFSFLQFYKFKIFLITEYARLTLCFQVYINFQIFILIYPLFGYFQKLANLFQIRSKDNSWEGNLKLFSKGLNFIRGFSIENCTIIVKITFFVSTIDERLRSNDVSWWLSKMPIIEARSIKNWSQKIQYNIVNSLNIFSFKWIQLRLIFFSHFKKLLLSIVHIYWLF